MQWICLIMLECERRYEKSFYNLGTGQTCPREHCDHDIHHHEMDPLSSIVSRDNELQERPQPVLGIWSKHLRRRKVQKVNVQGDMVSSYLFVKSCMVTESIWNHSPPLCWWAALRWRVWYSEVLLDLQVFHVEISSMEEVHSTCFPVS